MKRKKIYTFRAIDGEDYVEYYDKKLGDFVIKKKRVTWLGLLEWSHIVFYTGGVIFLLLGLGFPAFKIWGKFFLWCFGVELIGAIGVIAGYWIIKGIKAILIKSKKN